jgi:ribosome-interacting GTPase 1
LTDTSRTGLIRSLKEELYEAGIRINQTPPDITIAKKAQGGIFIQTNLKQTISKETIKQMAMEFGIRNADIVIKEKIDFERLIDALSQNRVFIPAIFVVNKIDISEPQITDELKNEKPIFISAEKGIGINHLKEAIWNSLKLVRVFLVRPNEEPDFNHPIIAQHGQTLGQIAEAIGSDFAGGKKLAKIWGHSAHFPGQEVPLSTKVIENLQVRFI